MAGISSDPNPLGSCPVQPVTSKVLLNKKGLQHPRVKIPTSASAALLEDIHSSNPTIDTADDSSSVQPAEPVNLLRKQRHEDPERVKAVTHALIRSQLITAEIKTNVMLRNECRVLQGISAFLADAYDQPEESIGVIMNHGTCMLFEDSLQAACIVTIHALPFNLQAITNNKVTSTLTNYLKTLIRVVPRRIAIRFVAVEEHMFGMFGLTVPEMVEFALKNNLGSDRSKTIAKGKTAKSSTTNMPNDCTNDPSTEPEGTFTKSSDDLPAVLTEGKKIRQKRTFFSNLFSRNKSDDTVPGSK